MKVCAGANQIVSGLISEMLVVVDQSGINGDVFSDQCLHITQKCDTGWEHRAFHH